MVNLVLFIRFFSMYDNQGIDSVGFVSETVLVYMHHSVEYDRLSRAITFNQYSFVVKIKFCRSGNTGRIHRESNANTLEAELLESLLNMVIPHWSNLWLVDSFVLTMLIHILILYVQPLSILFSVTSLSWADWAVVLYLSFSGFQQNSSFNRYKIIIIDEILKFFSRNSYAPRLNMKFRRPDLLPKRESRDNEAHHN